MRATHVVELTPAGRAAVAVVLVAGPDATRAVGECFMPASGRALMEFPCGRIVLGRWGEAGGEELIVCRRSETEVEIHCHGGTAAVNAIIGQLVEHGCRRIGWRDWLRTSSERSEPEGDDAPRSDALARSAHLALADATTFHAAAVLLDQYHGALDKAIRSAAGAIAAADWERAGEILDGLLRFGHCGLHLTTPWRVVLAGAPNVGKSSLINAVAGYQRAIVSPQPGTTRDVVTTSTAIAGWPVQLADTAGLRETADALESAGVALAAQALADADLVVLVRDASGAGVASRAERDVDRIVGALPPSVRVMHVHNKIDLADAAQRQALVAGAAFATSAVTGERLGELVNAIGRLLVPVEPPPGAAVPFTAGQVQGLVAARRAVDRRDAATAASALEGLLAGR